MTQPAAKPTDSEPSNNLWIAAMPAGFVFLWSTGFIGAKYGMPYAEPFSFLVTRFAIVIALMSVLCILSRAPWPRNPKTILHIAIAGTLVNGVYLGGVFSAVRSAFP